MANSSVLSKIGGQKSLLNDTEATTRGVHANFPAQIPKYSTSNSLGGVLETAFRLYLPHKELLTAFPEDRDILIPLTNGNYIDLIVTQVQETFQETVEVKRLINGSYAAYFFGMEPPQFSYTGSVLNDFQNDWANQLLRVYARYLRGTQLAKQGRKVVLSYNDKIVTGQMVSLFEGQTGAGESYCSFMFAILVKKMQIKIGTSISDRAVKDSKPLANPDTPVKSETKTQGAVVSSSGVDPISKSQLTTAEATKQLNTLESNKKTEQANLVAAQTRLDNEAAIFRQILSVNNNEFTDPLAVAQKKRVDAAARDVSATQTQISQIEVQQKEIRDGSAQKKEYTRSTNATPPVLPSSVVLMNSSSKPPVNRRIQ